MCPRNQNDCLEMIVVISSLPVLAYVAAVVELSGGLHVAKIVR